MSRVVIFYFFQRAYHFAVGDMKYSVEMQSVIVFPTLPYADILPPIASNKFSERLDFKPALIMA